MSKSRKSQDVKDAISASPLVDGQVWSTEDLPRLAEEIDRLASTVASQTESIRVLQSYCASLEARLSQIPLPEKDPLPLDVASGLSPAALYQSAIQAALISLALTQPKVIQDPTFRARQIDKVMDYAREIFDLTMKEWGLRARK